MIAGSSGSTDFLTRYHPDGTLDTSFGTNGRTTINGLLAGLHGLAIDAQGRILVAGSRTGTTGFDFAVSRYLNDGTLDTSFASNGIDTVDIGGARDFARGVIVDAQGGIILFGDTGTMTGFPDMATVRIAVAQQVVLDAGQQTIALTNVPPTANATGPTAALEGNAVTFQGTFSDPGVNDAPFQYAWEVSASNGQSLAQSGTVAGTVPDLTFTPRAPGTYLVSLVVTDKDGGSSPASIVTLTVGNVAPTPTVTGPTTADEGTSLAYQGSFTDPGQAFDGPYSYTWTVVADNGQVVAPVTGNVPTTGAVPDLAFTPDDNGNYVISLVISDKRGATSLASTISLAVADVAPIANVSGPASSDEGDPVTFHGTFTDPGILDAPYSFTWQAIADNGQVVAPLSGTVAAAGSVPDFTFTPVDNGNYVISLVISDKGGATSLASTISLTVADVAPTANVSGPASSDEGDPVTFHGTFTDPGVLDAPYSFTWQAIADNGQVVTPVSGTVSAAGSVPDFTFTPVDNGNYTVSLIVADKDGVSSAISQATLSVRNEAPVVHITSGPTTGAEGESVTYQGAFTDGGLDAPYGYVWTVVASNGQGVPQLAGSAAGTGPVPDFTFTPDDNGMYTVSLIVTDKDGASALARTDINVDNVAPTITNVTGPSPLSPLDAATLSGTFQDPSPGDNFTVTVNWGDGTVDRFAISAESARTFQMRHVYTALGDHAVTIEIMDKDGGRARASTMVQVTNVASFLLQAEVFAATTNTPGNVAAADDLAPNGLPDAELPPSTSAAGLLARESSGSIEANGSVTGQVYRINDDDRDDPALQLGDIKVVLEREDDRGFFPVASVVTGADGGFAFTGLPHGRYRLGLHTDFAPNHRLAIRDKAGIRLQLPPTVSTMSAALPNETPAVGAMPANPAPVEEVGRLPEDAIAEPSIEADLPRSLTIVSLGLVAAWIAGYVPRDREER